MRKLKTPQFEPNDGKIAPNWYAMLKDSFRKEQEADYTCTQIIDPPQVVQLNFRHLDKVTINVRDVVKPRCGTAVHADLARYKYKDWLVEKTLSANDPYMPSLSGTIDLFDIATNTLWDTKTTSAWTFKWKSRFEDWENQLNVYAALLSRHGFTVKHLKLQAWLRDWLTKDHFQNKADGYPRDDLHLHEVPLWSNLKACKYVARRLVLHDRAQKLPDDRLPECTDKERWLAQEGYAVMANKRGKAINGGASKHHPDMDSALVFAQSQKKQDHYEYDPEAKKGTLYIKHDPGGYKRCQSWCYCKDYCKQLQREKEAKLCVVTS